MIYKSKFTDGEFVLIKINPGEDIITKIEDVCIQYDFKSASIVSAIGSLEKACYVYAKSDPITNKTVYSNPINVSGPVELLSCQGVFGEDLEQGKYTSHIHASFTDCNNKVYGGHMLKDSNLVLVTVEVTLIGYKKDCLKKFYDNETGFNIFKFK